MGYKVRPHCGANLDPGEKCDCMDEDAEQYGERTDHNEKEEKDNYE